MTDAQNDKKTDEERDRDDPEQFLDTSHLQESLKERSVQGGAFTVGAQGMKFVLRLGSTAVLARLLMPEHFGLLGMVVAVTGFVRMFKDAGLSMATVQREDISHEQVSTLFWLNAALSLGVALVIAASSPAVAWFYGEPRLTGITLALSVTAFITGFGIQHNALLRRRMRFGRIAAIEVGSMAVGVAVAITAAWLGAGYWALVLNMAVNRTVNTAAKWIACGWRPGWPVRGSGVRELVAFGGNLTAGRVVNYAVRNVDDILLGAVWGPAALGFYRKAYALLKQPIRQINGPISAVAVPALSRLQDSPERYRSYYVQGIRFMTSLGMPLVVFCFVQADDIVGLVLGSKWTEVVPIFRALGPAAFIGTINVAGGWVFLPLGLGKRRLRCALYGGLFAIAGFIVGVRWGAVGMAIAFTVTECVKKWPQLWYAYRGTPIRFRDLGRAVLHPALGALLAGAGTWALRPVFAVYGHFLNLVIQSLAFAVLYAGVWLATPGGRAFVRKAVTSGYEFLTVMLGRQWTRIKEATASK